MNRITGYFADSARYKKLNAEFNEWYFEKSEPYLILRQKTTGRIYKTWDCLENEKKAKSVAKHLVNNWYTAYLISKANEAIFISVLQPFIDFTGENYQNLLKPHG